MTSNDFAPGSIVAGCRIESALGQGGMGSVYLAWQLSLERRVALKVIRTDLAEDPHVRARFLQEARLAAALEHPNVVAIYAVAEEHRQPVLVMRYIDGIDLARLLRERGAISPRRAMSVATQTASALDAAHRRGIVHRDKRGLLPGVLRFPDLTDAKVRLLTEHDVELEGWRGARRGHSPGGSR